MKLIHSVLRRAAEIPGAIDLSVTLADILGRAPRVDTSWRHLEQWIEELDRAEGTTRIDNPAPRDPILFFAIYPHWIDYSLAIATLLVGRGVAVDFWWKGEMTPLAKLPVPARKHFWNRHANRHSDAVSHPRLSLCNLNHITPVEATYLMRSCAEQQARIDVSYLLQKERIDLDGDPGDQQVFSERYDRNLNAIRSIAAVYETKHYSRILFGSGGVLEFGAVYRYFEALGKQITTFESVDIRNRIWVSHGTSVVRTNTSEMWHSDEPHTIDAKRRDRVLHIMKMRQSPESNSFVFPYQKASPTSAQSIRKQLCLDEKLPTVLICPNVPFDAVFYSGGRQIFAGMWEWLVESCRYLAKRSDCQVVIRCHPAEPYYDTKETARALLDQYLPALPDHIHIVAPTDHVSTYSIMEVTDLGVIFASTTGLEMALRGIPVVCGNPSQHSNRKGFTIDPDTREEYFGTIDQVLNNPKEGRLTDRQVELAYCYADLYFNRWYRRFPLQAQSLWSDLKTWPMSRILSPEGEAEFGPVLDELMNGSKSSGNHQQ